jgi:hypothetical protein
MNSKLFCTFLLVLSSISFYVAAQEYLDPLSKPPRHTVGVYLGFLEYDINYERNIMQCPKSYSNIRLGFGYWTDLQSEGHYVNSSFVYLTGKQNSHLELNLGFKFIVSGARSGLEGSQNFLLPDIFVGYRYEKPGKGDVYRIGVGYPGLIMVGGGIKF